VGSGTAETAATSHLRDPVAGLARPEVSMRCRVRMMAGLVALVVAACGGSAVTPDTHAAQVATTSLIGGPCRVPFDEVVQPGEATTSTVAAMADVVGDLEWAH